MLGEHGEGLAAGLAAVHARPACRPRAPARAARRTPRAGRRAGRGRGRSRGRTRRRRRRGAGSAAARDRCARRRRSPRRRAGARRPSRRRSSWAAARSAAMRDDRRSMPTVTTASTPAARASARASSGVPLSMSRWQCVSISPDDSAAGRCRARLRHAGLRLGFDAREQRRRRRRPRPGREPSQRAWASSRSAGAVRLAEAPQDLDRRVGHHRVERQGDEAQAAGQSVQHEVETLALALRLWRASRAPLLRRSG